jgi:hypothetical protein
MTISVLFVPLGTADNSPALPVLGEGSAPTSEVPEGRLSARDAQAFIRPSGTRAQGWTRDPQRWKRWAIIDRP